MRGGALSRRWSGSRLVAAMLMAATSYAAMSQALALHPPEDGVSIRSYFVGALLCGLIAGWKHMGRALGDGLGRAALGGVSAGISGLIYFLVIAGLRQTVRAYRFTQFDSPGKLFAYIIEQMVAVFWIAMEPQVLITILIGAAAAGVASETARRLWD